MSSGAGTRGADQAYYGLPTFCYEARVRLGVAVLLSLAGCDAVLDGLPQRPIREPLIPSATVDASAPAASSSAPPAPVVDAAVKPPPVRPPPVGPPPVPTTLVDAGAVAFTPSRGCLRATETPAYLFCLQQLLQDQAVLSCEALGMELASLETAEEDQLVTGVATLLPSTYWLSGKFEAGGWTWPNGDVFWVRAQPDLSYSNWIPGQPETQMGDNCLVLRTDGAQGWADEVCTRTFGFICEQPAP